MLSIGLMSGTSMDGIDAALLQTNGVEAIHSLGHVSIPYDPLFKIFLKATEFIIRKCHGDLSQAKLNFQQAVRDYLLNNLGVSEADFNNQWGEGSKYLPEMSLNGIVKCSTDLHAEAVKKLLFQTKYRVEDIAVVGYHGQTMFHDASTKNSIILGEGADLADQIGIKVVNDFRKNDLAAGGQGAPLAPLYHYALAMRDKKIPAVVVNCGGIANISIIPSDKLEVLVACDTGPGNGLLDRFVRERTAGREHMDFNGQYGKQGTVNEIILKQLRENAFIQTKKNYLFRRPPKSLDINDFILIPELENIDLAEGCATLAAFTADTIVSAFDLPEQKDRVPKHWILAGGGWNNPVIKRELVNRVIKKFGNEIEIQTADEIGWNNQALEAEIFAYLAVRSLQKLPLSLPGTTGVSVPMTGGCLHLPNVFL